MSYMIDIRVLELLCSRICHDLISPVTAINNGMELLDDDPGDMLEDIRDLLMNSASEGAGKLQYFRLAYGLGGDPDGEIGIGSAADLTVRLEKHEKSSITWPADRERMLPRLVMTARSPGSLPTLSKAMIMTSPMQILFGQSSTAISCLNAVLPKEAVIPR